MVKWKRFAVLAAVLCLMLLTACAQAPKETAADGDLLAAIRERGEIVVAMEGTWAPWGYHDGSGKLVGYDVEVAEAIAGKLGVKVRFEESEWSGCLAGLEGGRYDIMVNGMDVDESRKEKYDFSTPYAYNRTAVIVSGENDSIQSMEDLKGKHTANTLNSTYANVAEGYGAEVTGVDDFIQTIELLSSGRIDATLNAEVSYYDYMAQHPEANIKIACIDPEATQVAIPMRKGEESASLLAAVDKALAEMTADGTLSELSIKYFGTDISQMQ